VSSSTTKATACCSPSQTARRSELAAASRTRSS
jgi:hypothetical protein